jgi:hypothetical protein
MSDDAKKKSQDIVVSESEVVKTLIAAAQEEGGGLLGGKLLKFTKGHYFVGDDEIALGREYVAYPLRWVRGWVKFVDGKLVEQRIGCIADGFVMPNRDELGDTDEASWPKDSAGKVKDPWQRQCYLPLEDCENNEIVVFVSGSHGGRGAISDLVSVAAKNLASGDPRIKLGVGSYRHREYGRVEVPDFAVQGWTGKDDSVPF